MPEGKSAWFVDGAFLLKAWGSLRRPDRFDYGKLRRHLEESFGTRIGTAYYFNADPDPPQAALSSFHKWLSYPPPAGPGLRVKLYWLQKQALRWPPKLGGGPVLHPDTGTQFERQFQKAVDVGLAFHLMRSHQLDGWQQLFLAAGDADFHEVVQHLVEFDRVKLILIGTMGSISTELLPYGDLVDLEKIAEEISRQKSGRDQP